MADMSVYVSNSSDFPQHMDLCGVYPGAVPSAGSVTIQCEAPRIARYVRVENGDDVHDKHVLTLCEVVVMGYKVADCSECAEGGCDSLNGCVNCPCCKRKPDCKQDCGDDDDDDDVGCLCHCRYGKCSEATCADGCEDWWILPTCSEYIPAPNISHVTPHLSIQSTSIVIEYQQADIDESLAEFYSYVAQYKTEDSPWADAANRFMTLHTKGIP